MRPVYILAKRFITLLQHLCEVCDADVDVTMSGMWSSLSRIGADGNTSTRGVGLLEMRQQKGGSGA